MSRRFVEVALPPPLARELTYSVPPDIDSDIAIGSLVLVPVGRRLMTGVAIAEVAPSQLAPKLKPNSIRDVSQVLAGEALISAELIDLCSWISRYYFVSFATALMAALPPAFRSPRSDWSNSFTTLRSTNQTAWKRSF